MNILSLSNFVEVVRRGSFSAVAREHNVSPSHISRTIATLEKELGIRLFQRSTRRLELTEAGALYFERIAASVEEINQAGKSVTEMSDIPQGTLRITAPVDFGQLAITPLLSEFSQNYPEIHYDLQFIDAELDLLAEHIDVAIRLAPPSDYSYIGSKLFDEKFVICVSQSYLKKRGKPRMPDEIANHNCLHFPMKEYTLWSFHNREGNRIEKVKIDSHVEVSNSVVLRDCAVAGMGIALIPHWAVWQELDKGQLIELFADYTITVSELTTEAWLMYPTRRYLPLKVRVFVDFLKMQFANWPDNYKL